jgi:hypothetical protein
MGEPVFLVGSANEIGTLLGQHQQKVLSERIARTLAHAEKSGQTAVFYERAERLGAALESIAPHWLEETRALANAANFQVQDILALNCLPPDFWGKEYVPPPLFNAQSGELVSAFDAQGYEPLMGGDCTSFFALGESTISGETLFHKNREERDEVQCLYIKQNDNCFRYVAGNDIGNIGIAHVHTENYWAGANNTGSPVVPQEYEDCVLTDCHVLRYLAEKCESLNDIIPTLNDLIARKLLGGGGYEFGMIFLFADAYRGLVIECTSRRLAQRWFEGNEMAVRSNHFVLPEMQEFALPPRPGSVARYDRASELWQAAEGHAGISTCGEIARDRETMPHAIARNPSDGWQSATVSTSTTTISPHDDRRCATHFRNCHPSYTPAVIFTPLDRVSDADLLSGAHNQEWRFYRGWA